jgi:hypothetical protein
MIQREKEINNNVCTQPVAQKIKATFILKGPIKNNVND